MCLHRYFYRGNEKQTRTTLKNTITNVTFIESTVYVSYIVPSTEPHFFSEKEGGGGGSAYSKF